MGVAIKVVRGRLRVYRENVHAEEWHQDHRWAALCFDFQELVREGLALFQSIANLDEDWRLSVHRKLLAYDPEFDQELRSLFIDWHDSSISVLRLFDRIKEQYVTRDFDVAVIEDLRRYVNEMNVTRQPNDELFAHDATFIAAENALREHRQQLTEAW